MDIRMPSQDEVSRTRDVLLNLVYQWEQLFARRTGPTTDEVVRSFMVAYAEDIEGVRDAEHVRAFVAEHLGALAVARYVAEASAEPHTPTAHWRLTERGLTTAGSHFEQHGYPEFNSTRSRAGEIR